MAFPELRSYNKVQPDDTGHYESCDYCGYYEKEPHELNTETTCNTSATCDICGWSTGPGSGHSLEAGSFRTLNENSHEGLCSKCETWVMEPHNWKERTCLEPETCRDCGQTRGKTALHNGLKVVFDKTEHWNVCTWCEIEQEGTRKEHNSEISGKCSTGGHYKKCTFCGYIESVTFETENYYDEQYHGEKCTVCGDVTEKNGHAWYTYSEPYDSGAGVSSEYDNAYKLFLTCSECHFPPVWIDTWQMDANGEGQRNVDEIVEILQEAYDNEEELDFSLISSYSITIDSTKSALDINCSHDFSNISYDNNLHWKQCSKCKGIQKNSLSSHTLGKAQSASATLGYHVYECSKDGCEYVKTEAHIFDNNGNCTADGCTAKKVTDCEHDFTKVCSDNQNHWIGCSICGEIKEGSKTKHTLGEGNINSEGVEIFVCTYEDCGHISRKYSSDYVIDGEQNNNTNNNSNNNSNSNNNNSLNNNSSNSHNKGNTTVNKPIPHAGNKTMIVLIIVIATIGIISYIKFKKTV